MKFESVSRIVTNIAITFVQAAFVAWMAVGFKADKIAIGAMVGAGLSAVWNVIIKPWLTQQGYINS